MFQQRPMYLLRGFDGLRGGDDDGFGEKIEPCFPIAGQPHFVQQFVVILAMAFEIEAQIQHRFLQDLLFAQQERHQLPALRHAGNQHRMQIGAGGVNGSGITGRNGNMKPFLDNAIDASGLFFIAPH